MVGKRRSCYHDYLKTQVQLNTTWRSHELKDHVNSTVTLFLFLLIFFHHLLSYSLFSILNKSLIDKRGRLHMMEINCHHHRHGATYGRPGPSLRGRQQPEIHPVTDLLSFQVRQKGFIEKIPGYIVTVQNIQSESNWNEEQMLNCVEQLAPLSLCNSDYNNLNLTVTLQYGIHIKHKTLWHAWFDS